MTEMAIKILRKEVGINQNVTDTHLTSDKLSCWSLKVVLTRKSFLLVVFYLNFQREQDFSHQTVTISHYQTPKAPTDQRRQPETKKPTSLECSSNVTDDLKLGIGCWKVFTSDNICLLHHSGRLHQGQCPKRPTSI